jgi:hypothetical protein
MTTLAASPPLAAPRLSLRVSRCAIAIVILALLAYASAGGGSSAALGLIIASLGWWLTSGDKPLAIPKWLIAIALALVVARGAFALGNRPQASIAPFLTFLASIMVVKCWERRGIRDLAQIFAIATFVLIGAALGSNTFSTGLLIAVAFPFLVHGSLLLQLEVARARVEQLTGPLSTAASPPKGRATRLTAILIALGVALATIVFVFVPRTQGSSGFAALGMAGARISGFRDRVELGRAGLINQSQSIVMEVEVPKGEGLPNIAGPQGELYLRGAVLTYYHHLDGDWKRAPAWETPDETRDLSSDFQGVAFPPVTRLPLTPRGEREATEIIIRDKDRIGDNRPFFTVWRPRLIFHNTSDPVRIDINTTTGSGTFTSTVPAEYRVVCSLESGSTIDDQPRHPPIDYSAIVNDIAHTALAGSGISPDPAVRPASEDFRAVRLLEQHLREHCSYSRRLGAPPENTAPVDWFLSTAKEGHCEYFASALAAMCRSIGVNARVVTGYLTGEFDEQRRIYTVRQASAHAWVEAEIAPGRWRTFDATPAEELSRLAGVDTTVMLKLERWLAGIETAWNSSVVNYGHASGQRSARDGVVARALTRWSHKVESWIRELGIVRAITWVLIVVGGASLAFAALGFALKAAIRATRRTSPHHHTRTGEAARIYNRFLRACARLGHPKPTWRGAQEHIDSLPESLRPHAQHIVTACYESFFAGREPHDSASLAASLAALESATHSPRK